MILTKRTVDRKWNWFRRMGCWNKLGWVVRTHPSTCLGLQGLVACGRPTLFGVDSPYAAAGPPVISTLSPAVLIPLMAPLREESPSKRLPPAPETNSAAASAGLGSDVSYGVPRILVVYGGGRRRRCAPVRGKGGIVRLARWRCPRFRAPTPSVLAPCSLEHQPPSGRLSLRGE
jgi:hypothetical protein